jgi:subtilase family serine protease
MSIKSFVVAAVIALAAPLALANTVTSDPCPGTGGTRVFSATATTVNSCLLRGTGNINGNNQADAGFIASGWIFVDDSDASGGAHNGWLTITGTGALTGTFTINPLAYSTYDNIAIGFKSGEGTLDPDWAIFLLNDNTLSGTWSISGQQALSHAILYGMGTPGRDVPEPGILALLGLGLVGLGMARRRKS